MVSMGNKKNCPSITIKYPLLSRALIVCFVCFSALALYFSQFSSTKWSSIMASELDGGHVTSWSHEIVWIDGQLQIFS